MKGEEARRNLEKAGLFPGLELPSAARGLVKKTVEEPVEWSGEVPGQGEWSGRPDGIGRRTARREARRNLEPGCFLGWSRLVQPGV